MSQPDQGEPSRFADLSPFARTIAEHLRASFQVLHVPTTEEVRAVLEIAAASVAVGRQKAVIHWDNVHGFTLDATATVRSLPKGANSPDYRDPVAAISAIINRTGKADVFEGENYTFVFHDLDDFTNSPHIRRLLAEGAENKSFVNSNIRRPLIILTAARTLHPKVLPHTTTIEFAFPDLAKMFDIIDYIQGSIGQSANAARECSAELREKLAYALLGLTGTEAENVLSLCIARFRRFCPQMLETIMTEKATIIKRGEVLTYIPYEQIMQLDHIGGFENVLEFVGRQKAAYSKEARAQVVDLPKGLLLLGLPGTAKSQVAMAIGRVLELPVYIMDIGAVFGSLVGESEGRMRDAIRLITAQQGCVVVLDELDKALGGVSGGSNDSGTTKRVLGTMLSWLASRKDRTYVVGTLNRTEGIPGEFLRAGRFDRIFYTTLPGPYERRQILEIHLRKRNVDPTNLFSDAEWSVLLDKTQDFVGSELEQLVIDARSNAFASTGNATPNLEHTVVAANEIRPLAKLDAAAVAATREFVESRAFPASRIRDANTVLPEQTLGGRRRRGLG